MNDVVLVALVAVAVLVVFFVLVVGVVLVVLVSDDGEVPEETCDAGVVEPPLGSP